MITVSVPKDSGVTQKQLERAVRQAIREYNEELANQRKAEAAAALTTTNLPGVDNTKQKNQDHD